MHLVWDNSQIVYAEIKPGWQFERRPQSKLRKILSSTSFDNDHAKLGLSTSDLSYFLPDNLVNIMNYN